MCLNRLIAGDDRTSGMAAGEEDEDEDNNHDDPTGDTS